MLYYSFRRTVRFIRAFPYYILETLDLQGAYTYDVRKMFRLLDPLPCAHLSLTCSIELTQPPLLGLLFRKHSGSPPSSAYVIYGSPPRASTSARAPLRRLHSPLSDRCKSRPSRAARSFLVPSTTERPRPGALPSLTKCPEQTREVSEAPSERSLGN